MKKETLKAAQSRKTKAALINAGKKLFGRKGFANVGLDEIALLAGVTTGAIYHNFGSKKKLFQQVHGAMAEVILLNAKEESRRAVDKAQTQSIERAILGMTMAFESISSPPNRRVLLEDGPTILGHRTSRVQFSGKAVLLIEQGLRRLMAESRIEQQPPELLAHMLFGALVEASNLSFDEPNSTLSSFEKIVLSMVGPVNPAKTE